MQDPLPDPFPWKRNVAGLLTLTVILYSGYQLSNRFHLTEPRYLPMTPLDGAIPFYTWTVWPYFLLVLLAYLTVSIRSVALFRRTMIAFTIGVSINIAVWLLFPTVYHRPPMPQGDGATLFAYRWLCSVDTPANCFPSGHITTPAIGCWALASAYPKFRVALWALFSFLCLTILTTKQHYAIDLPAGLLTACLGIWLSGVVSRRWKAARRH